MKIVDRDGEDIFNRIRMTFIDSIVVYDVDDHHFDEIAFVTVEAGQDAKELAVYYVTAYVFVTRKGLVEYQSGDLQDTVIRAG
jgi:hypothetical protein